MYGSGVSTTSSPPAFCGTGAPPASRMEYAIGPSDLPLRSGRTAVVGKTPRHGAANSVCQQAGCKGDTVDRYFAAQAQRTAGHVFLDTLLARLARRLLD